MFLKTLALAPYLIPRSACVEGPKIAQYERAFAERVGAKHAVAFMKGRFAFYAGLKALGIGAGDEVLMPGYTCAVVPAAVVNLGATPVYVDIEPTYCTAPLARFEQAVTSHTRAIMIQHTYGWPNVDLAAIIEFARDRNIPVFEDCCHALGTSQSGRHVGNWGIGGFFSTQWSKPFTTGLGGVLVCNDDQFHHNVVGIREQYAHAPSARLAAQIAAQNIVFDLFVYPSTMAFARRIYRKLTRSSLVTGSTSCKEYEAWDESQFLRMSRVQAVAGLVDLAHVSDCGAWRRELMDYYADALDELGFDVPTMPADSTVALLRFPVRVSNKAAAMEGAAGRCLELGDWFIQPMHSNILPAESLGYRFGMCPEAERASREMVNLPTHYRVTRGHARRLIAFLREYCAPAD